MEHAQQDWQRLGALLAERRRWLGYRSRSAFAHAKGLSHDRILADVEKVRRSNYRASTIDQIERIYEWASGSIEAVLAGREPTPVETTMPERGRRARLDEFTREELYEELARRKKEELERRQRDELAAELAEHGLLPDTGRGGSGTVVHELGHLLAAASPEDRQLLAELAQQLGQSHTVAGARTQQATTETGQQLVQRLTAALVRTREQHKEHGHDAADDGDEDRATA